jgi:hypothetical protein
MTEDQLRALEALMRTIAYQEAGRAVNQPRCKGNVAFARNSVRVEFGLPTVENEDDDA